MVMPIRTKYRSSGRYVLVMALLCMMAVFIPRTTSGADTPEEIFSIETIGTAPVDADDPFSAEQKAIHNALQLAIDEGVAEVLPSDILTDNFNEIITTFYGSAETFILNYKKLAVAKGDDYCRVLVRSTILADDIEERIKQAGILIDRESSPRLLILLTEEYPGEPPLCWWRQEAAKVMAVAEQAMAEDFTRRGIAMVAHERQVPGLDLSRYPADLNDQEAIEIGRQLGADFVITGKSTLILPDGFMPEKAGNAMGFVEARLLESSTARRIYMTSLQRQADDAGIPPDAFAALALAGRAAARQFSPILISAYEQQKNRSRVFQIRIQGAGYLTHLNTFRHFLDAIDRVKRPQINEMKIDEAVISVDFAGSIRELAGTLAETPSDRLTITVTDALDDTVFIELTTPQRAADLDDTKETFRP